MSAAIQVHFRTAFSVTKDLEKSPIVTGFAICKIIRYKIDEVLNVCYANLERAYYISDNNYIPRIRRKE